MDHKVSFEQRPVLYDVQIWVMVDIVLTSSYVTHANTSSEEWTTPSESRQAPSGASAGGLQYASRPVSRVGPGSVYSLRVLVNYYVVYGVVPRLLWRNTRHATFTQSRSVQKVINAHAKNRFPLLDYGTIYDMHIMLEIKKIVADC